MSMTYNRQLPSPHELKEQYPLPAKLGLLKAQRDREIRQVFQGESEKFLVIVGPCSADREDTVLEYCLRLAALQEKVGEKLLLVPRVYTNKPRTTGAGYKGMLHQPSPDKAPDLLGGIIAIRRLHLRVMEETGLTSADEMLYPENRSYLDDVLSYEAVGGPVRGEPAAPAHRQRHGHPRGHEEPHQRRPFRDAQLHPGGPVGAHLPLPGLGRDHHRQPPGPRHPPRGRGQVRHLRAQLPL